MKIRRLQDGINAVHSKKLAIKIADVFRNFKHM